MKKIICALFISIISSFSSHAETLSDKQLASLNQQVKQYDYIGPFFEGLAMVRKEGKVGFIDKTGKLAIPMKFTVTNECVSPSNDCLNIFLHGILASYELGVIDRQGKVIVPKDSIKHIGIANDGDIVIVSSQAQYYVYEKGTFISNRQPVWNYTTNEVLTFNGKIAFDEDMEARGYTRFDTDFTKGKPYAGVWITQPFVVQKNGKFGVIDRLGNELVPCFSDDYRMTTHKGLALIAHRTFNGEQDIPVWHDVYKDGIKVVEKVSMLKPFRGHNFILAKGLSEEEYNNWKDAVKIELPHSVKDSMMLDLDGKRITQAPFGKNFFTIDKEGGLAFVKKDGTPVFDKKVAAFFEPIGSYYFAEFEYDAQTVIINENADTVKAKPKLLRYVEDGTITFKELRKYSSIEYINFPYLKSQSKQDKLATLEYHAGRMAVKPMEYDKSFFSEGLINLKINGEWCYMDKDGAGKP